MSWSCESVLNKRPVECARYPFDTPPALLHNGQSFAAHV